MATEKNKTFADLIVPFMRCPFVKVESDCPFNTYREIKAFDEILSIIDKMSEHKLQNLRKHHKVCLLKKLKKGEEMDNL